MTNISGGGTFVAPIGGPRGSGGHTMSDDVSEIQMDGKNDRKPIGGDEADFEAVLIDGILGFSLSFGNAILLIIGAVSHAATLVEGSLMVVVLALVAAGILKVVQLKTDAISASHPRVFYACAHATSFLVAVAGMYLGLPFLSVVASAVALADTLILYGRFLAALARKALMLVVDSAFLYPGILLMVIVYIPAPYDVIVLSVMVLITIVVVLLFIRRDYDFGELVSAAESKSRSIKVKGNIHTLFLTGFMLAALLLMRPLPFDIEVTMTALGLAFVIASVLSLIMRSVNERASKDTLRKSIALASACLLLPIAIIPDEAKLALLACYACFVVLTSLIILDAIIETVRFNILAAMWLIGKECSVYFCGMAVGALLAMTYPCLTLLVGSEHAMLYICIAATVFCAWMQIKVNYQIYPYEPIIEEPVDEEVTANIERNGRRKAQWNQKIDTVCEQYKLSPREREILPILLRGRDAKYIMDTFYISQSTAKTHIYNIYRKFGIHSRQELLDFVEEIEFIDFGLVDTMDTMGTDPDAPDA